MIRLTLFIHKEEEPLLHELLSARKKGVRRGNIAKRLMHAGALAQRGLLSSAADKRDGGMTKEATGPAEGAEAIFEELVSE